MPDPTASDGAVISENAFVQPNAPPILRQQGAPAETRTPEPDGAVLLPIGVVIPNGEVEDDESTP